MDTNTMIWIVVIVAGGILLWIFLNKKWGKTIKFNPEKREFELIEEKDWHKLDVDNNADVRNIEQKWWTQNEIKVWQGSKVSNIKQW